MMDVCALACSVVRTLALRGCERREDLDDKFSLFFVHLKSGQVFSIPRPLLDGGYTQGQLEFIEKALAPMDIELLPIETGL